MIRLVLCLPPQAHLQNSLVKVVDASEVRMVDNDPDEEGVFFGHLQQEGKILAESVVL
jgi:hypothetical protein